MSRPWKPSRERPGDSLALALLAGLVGVGLVLRGALMATRAPAFLGAFDSFWYMDAARDQLFSAPTWPAGYPLLLRILHALDGSLTFTILVQHALGVATALLLFWLVRQVAPAAWGLLPAAVVLLAGPQAFLEHAPLSDTSFTFLIVASCACAVRARGERELTWAAAAGLLGIVAGCIRSVGTLFPALVVIWLAAVTPGGLRRRLLTAGIAALAAWLVLAVYVTFARYESGYVGPGLSRAGAWSLYVRVAPFADCTRFHPPPGTRGLCEDVPPSKRPAGPYYLRQGPGIKTFGSFISTRPDDNRALAAFARAAIVHQPWAYARAVATDLTRYWSSEATDPGLHHSYDGYFDSLVDSNHDATTVAGAWYTTARPPPAAGVPSVLRAWQRHTRLEGPVFVLLVLMALLGVPLARGDRLAVGLLLLGVSTLLLVLPAAGLAYHPRYAVPAYGLLAATAALGGASLWERLPARQPRRRETDRADLQGQRT